MDFLTNPDIDTLLRMVRANGGSGTTLEEHLINTRDHGVTVSKQSAFDFVEYQCVLEGHASSEDAADIALNDLADQLENLPD